MYDPGRKWTILEYAARFKYDQTLAELVAESESDAQFYDSFLSARSLSVDVFASHHIIDDPPLLESMGLRSGVKGKCLAIARHLTDFGAHMGACVVVDHDYDGNSGSHTRHLLLTDGFSLEMYSFDPDQLDVVLKKFFARAHRLSGREMLERATPPLRWIGAARRTLWRETPSVALAENWLSFVDFSETGPTVRREDLIRQSLHLASASYSRSAVTETIARVELEEASILSDDLMIRGHDFTDFLLKDLQGRWGRKRGIDLKGWDRDSFEGILRLGLEMEKLIKRPLFKCLDDRWASGSSPAQGASVQ